MEPNIVQGLALATLLVIFVANAVVRRREQPPQRPIAAYANLQQTTSESIEAGRSLHLSLGSATVGDETTLLALVGAEFLYYLTRKVAISDAAPIVTVTDGAAVSLGIDVLRRAYATEQRPEQFRAFNARWYPEGSRSLAFATAVMALQGDDRTGLNVLTGSHGIELSLMLDPSNRLNLPTIAVSNQLEGQAVAYAMSQYPLIGEEIFAASGYISKDLKWAKRNLVLDLTRWLLALALVALFIFNLVRGLL